MCGRTACTLAPDIICRACSYKDPTGSGSDSKFKKPQWKDHPQSKDSGTSYAYYPSANIAPTKFTPVMIRSTPASAENVDEEEAVEDEGRDIIPMMFGMIPAYHKGDAKSHGMSTNNCRLEGVLESKMYKPLWDKRKFCVVVAQGFYEWKTTDKDPKAKKQPYLIYAPQPQGSEEEKATNVADNTVWENSEWNEETGWHGPEILKMAGLYNIWKSPQGDEVYSFTIITMESNDTLSWLHHRMPAILDSEEKVYAWLNATPKTDTSELMSILQPVKRLDWHPVDPKVGNSRCHDMDCMNPVTAITKKKTFMDNWLIKKSPVKVKAEEPSEGESEAKKLKK